MDDNQLRREARLLSPTEVCAELLALSVVEHSYAPLLRITVALDGSRGEICDTGRGMRLTPDRGDTLSHVERALTSVYPCLPMSAAIESVLLDLIWGERGSLGPALANSACASLQFISKRGGEAWSQKYRYGMPIGPARMLGSTEATGTTIRFETTAPIDRAGVAALVDRLNSRIPGLPVILRAAR